MLTDEQIKNRVNFIGGSDAAAVLGLSRWKTPIQVWALKTGLLPEEDKTDSLPIEIGNELEDVVARLFTRRTGKTVHRVNETVFHPKYPFLGANLDRRVVGEDAILEVKTASGWKAREWEGQDIPQEYIIQVLHYLAVTGKDRGYIAVLIGGNQDFQWKVVERDEALISQIVAKEVEFWTKYVEPKAMPPLNMVKASDSATLYKLYPHADDEAEPVVLGDDAARLIESIQATYRDVCALEDSLERDRNALKAMLGAKAVGLTNLHKVSWKEVAKKGYEVKPSKSRQLRITPIRTNGSKEA